MLTVKQEGKRIVNPNVESILHITTKESLFKILVVECGFMASHRKDVWTHTKDDKFSVQIDYSKGFFLFEYSYTMDKIAYPKDIGGGEFVTRFLESSRNFYQTMTT